MKIKIERKIYNCLQCPFVRLITDIFTESRIKCAENGIVLDDKCFKKIPSNCPFKKDSK